ncbi:MAG: fumarylacetoacetate hydrolase family protein [Acidimicrobiales bacterium]
MTGQTGRVASLAVAPSKIIAVHLNYRSRAAERGKLPTFPSYFFKPPSSLGKSDDVVVRPAGCELLAFEGEVALVMGTRCRGVTLDEAWSYVAHVTAANDFGVYDLRYADAGSNVRSKGCDGFTPLGPWLLDAHAIDPQDIELTTYLNGNVVQKATVADEMIFSFGQIVADLARTMTLERGDVILTGTPTGASVAEPGDLVEVELRSGGKSTGRLRSTIASADGALARYGAMPRPEGEARAAALGRPVPESSDHDLANLAMCSAATIASQLHKRGIDDTVMAGLSASRPGVKMVGFARTLRYLPCRGDLADMSRGMNAQKRAVESIQPGEVLVIGARGEAGAGTIGDILALRAQRRGAAGTVTDGAVRDASAIGRLELPVFYSATNPAVLGRRHVPWDTDVAIACAGVLVKPGDAVVGDDDGVVVVPLTVLSEVARDAVEQERQERFISERVAGGEAIEGLYPLGSAWLEPYKTWCQSDDAVPEPPSRPDSRQEKG